MKRLCCRNVHFFSRQPCIQIVLLTHGIQGYSGEHDAEGSQMYMAGVATNLAALEIP